MPTDNTTDEKHLSLINSIELSDGSLTERPHLSASPEVLKEVDQAFKYALDTQGLVLDPVKEKNVLRKIDWYVLPLMCALMACQLMDKSINSYAAIMGLRTDLNMSGEVYSWVGSSFYLAYLVFEYPANLILQRYPLSKVLSTVVILWGIIVCVHSACQSGPTFLLCRTILGCLQSFMDPAYMLMTSQWYKKEEQYTRSAIWLGFMGLGSILASGVGFGLWKNQDAYHLAAWRVMYIVCGVITIFFGFISLFHIPDIPTKAWFLDEDEKKYVVERVRSNRTGFGNPVYKQYQLIEATKDVTWYIFFFYMFGYGVSNGALGNFGSIMLDEEFDFTTGQSLLLNMVGGAIDIIFPVAFAWLNDRIIKSRLVTCLFINLLNFSGLIMLGFAGRNAQIYGYFVTYLMTASWATMSSLLSSNIAGHTKKITANTLFLIGFAAGNIVGPQAFIDSEAPIYATSKNVMIGAYSVNVAAPIALFVIYYFRNKKKEREAEGQDFSAQKYFFGDMTDFENPAFRYEL